MKRRVKTFPDQIEVATRDCAIYDHHRLTLTRALGRGLKRREAAAEAAMATAQYFKTTVRTVQRAIKAWPAQEGEIRRAANADANFTSFREWATQHQAITEWFTAAEYEEIRGLSLPEQALRAITRATAAAQELRREVALQKKLAAKLIGRNRQLEAQLKKSQMAEAVKVAVHNASAPSKKTSR